VTKFVARQPIFDCGKNIFAYELLFRSSLDNFFRSDQPDNASSSVMVDSFLLLGMKSLTGGRKAFLNVTRNLLMQQYVTLLPQEQAVVEIPEDVRVDESLLMACRGLKQKGYLIVLDDFAWQNEANPLVGLADIIKVDFLKTPPGIRRQMVERFNPLGIKMLAEKVETHDDFREAVKLGYTYLQGFFFCRPEILSIREVPAFKLNYLSLLHALNRADIDFAEVERVIKREASLCYKLLRYLNSAAFYFCGEINSIRHALSLLGLSEIRKWASLVAMADMGKDKPAALVITSMVRARFCETLAPLAGFAQRATEIFLMGLFSVMDAILEKPMVEILQELPLSRDVKEALTGGKGCFQWIYELSTCYECGDWQKIGETAATLKLSEQAISEAYIQAVKWAHEIFQIDHVTVAA